MIMFITWCTDYITYIIIIIIIIITIIITFIIIIIIIIIIIMIIIIIGHPKYFSFFINFSKCRVFTNLVIYF